MSSDKLKVNVNEYLPLRDVVFNTLRQAIITGEFVPGERLMEIALANRLGVSRTPVREAIRKLELEGLVVMIPRKGAEVARITEKDLRDVLEVRALSKNWRQDLPRSAWMMVPERRFRKPWTISVRRSRRMIILRSQTVMWNFMMPSLRRLKISG